MASILDWMGKYESKFGSDSHKPIVKKGAAPEGKSQKNIQKVKHKKSSNKDTLDRFIKTDKDESKLFDDDFGREDFILLTQRWQLKNAAHEVSS